MFSTNTICDCSQRIEAFFCKRFVFNLSASLQWLIKGLFLWKWKSYVWFCHTCIYRNWIFSLDLEYNEGINSQGKKQQIKHSRFFSFFFHFFSNYVKIVAKILVSTRISIKIFCQTLRRPLCLRVSQNDII